MQDQRTQVVSIIIFSLLSPLIVRFFFSITPFDVTFYTSTLSTKGLWLYLPENQTRVTLRDFSMANFQVA